jgi:L-lactate dehydrogenase
MAWSTARIGGVALADYPGADMIDRDAIGRDVMRAGYTINHGKGYTSYGVATAIVRICEAIVRDERMVVPVSTLVDGQYGLDGLYLSLPCLIGSAGILQVLTPELTAGERDALHASAATLRETLASIG